MTVSLATNIARPLSSALSSAFSMDAVGKLDAYGKLGSWSPLSLFASSEVGAWYDPSDLTTMFQDRAGTTPVTADGQTVGKILDKSGRGNHAVAPSDAARPLYKTDGTYHWLQFDGVDDGLSTGAMDLSTTNKLSIFAGLRKISDSARGIFVEMGANYAVAGSFGQEYADGGPNWRFTSPQGSLAYSISSPVTQVTTQLVDNAAASDMLIGRANGVQVVHGFVGPNYNFGNRAVGIGIRISDNTLPLNGYIYSMIIRGALSTTDEITNTETWVNSKTGAF